MEGYHIFNISFRNGYYLLIAIPVFYFLVSTLSYFSVLITLGDVPPYDSLVVALAKQKGKMITIFPRQYGSFLISMLFIEILFFWIWILLNYVTSRFVNGITFQNKLGLLLSLVNIISILILFMSPFGHWYLGYVLD
jgi:hypothetical protein